MSEEEHQSVWYSHDEYIALHMALRSTVKEFRRSNWSSSYNGQCRRGLEKYQLQCDRRRLGRHHFDAVLSEQLRQKELGIVDEERIREASLSTSAFTIQVAQRTAHHDAECVIRMLQYEQRQQEEKEDKMFLRILQSLDLSYFMDHNDVVDKVDFDHYEPLDLNEVAHHPCCQDRSDPIAIESLLPTPPSSPSHASKRNISTTNDCDNNDAAVATTTTTLAVSA
jgi:hypothetical protein